jgi:tRNA(Ile)-lysidine synthase
MQNNIKNNSFFKKTLNDALERSEKIAIGFSGGADSLALALLTKEYISKDFQSQFKKKEIYLLFVNHNLRKESVAESEFAKFFALKNFFNFKIFNLNFDSRESGNLHNQAHLKRYETMLDFCAQNSINSFLSAHHKDDQIETFFMRLQKGLGPCALCGIRSNKIFNEKFKNVMIFRPLLFVSKKEILNFLSLKNQIYIVDRSNFNQKYKRAQIRNSLSQNPLINDEFILNFDSLIKKFWNSENAMNFYIKKAFKEFVSFDEDDNFLFLNLEIFSKEPKETILSVFKMILKDFAGLKSMRILYDDLENLYENLLNYLNSATKDSFLKINLFSVLNLKIIKKFDSFFLLFCKSKS